MVAPLIPEDLYTSVMYAAGRINNAWPSCTALTMEVVEQASAETNRILPEYVGAFSVVNEVMAAEMRQNLYDTIVLMAHEGHRPSCAWAEGETETLNVADATRTVVAQNARRTRRTRLSNANRARRKRAIRVDLESARRLAGLPPFSGEYLAARLSEDLDSRLDPQSCHIFVAAACHALSLFWEANGGQTVPSWVEPTVLNMFDELTSRVDPGLGEFDSVQDNGLPNRPTREQLSRRFTHLVLDGARRQSAGRIPYGTGTWPSIEPTAYLDAVAEVSSLQSARSVAVERSRRSVEKARTMASLAPSPGSSTLRGIRLRG